jgi:hypothetical protein
MAAKTTTGSRDVTAERYLEPPVRFELTTARLQGGSAHLRGCSQVFAAAIAGVRRSDQTMAQPAEILPYTFAGIRRCCRIVPQRVWREL